VSAKGVIRTEGFSRYILDNGAWWAYANDQPFDEAAFLKAYDLVASGADFAVLPDIVAGGLQSLDFSLRWRERLGKPKCHLVLPVQDGMHRQDVEKIVGPELGIFIGGTTEWKENSMREWGTLARDTGAHLHVGRVNSARRIHLCVAAGAHSFDGSSASRFALSLPKLENARQQLDLLGHADNSHFHGKL
jgi:hypothetical protein